MSPPRFYPPLTLVPQPDSQEVGDAELGHALAAGSAWAHAEAWNRYAPGVYGMAVRTLGSEAEAEDVVRKVFRRVFVKAKTLRKPESLRSFIISFAIRILVWDIRRRKARSWLSFQPPESYTELLSETLDVGSRELLRKFYALLERLAPREHLVFALRHLETMTVDEMAAAMALSVSTVKRALDRATRRMSRWVADDLDIVAFMGRKGWRR